MEQVNLKMFQVTTVDDAFAVVEENGDPLPKRFHNHASSLERQLPLSMGGGHVLLLSQKGKKDTLFFTLGVSLFLSLFIVFITVAFSVRSLNVNVSVLIS